MGVDFGLGLWVLEAICFLFFLFYDFNNDKMERQSGEGVRISAISLPKKWPP